MPTVKGKLFVGESGPTFIDPEIISQCKVDPRIHYTFTMHPKNKRQKRRNDRMMKRLMEGNPSLSQRIAAWWRRVWK